MRRTGPDSCVSAQSGNLSIAEVDSENVALEVVKPIQRQQAQPSLYTSLEAGPVLTPLFKGVSCASVELTSVGSNVSGLLAEYENLEAAAVSVPAGVYVRQLSSLSLESLSPFCVQPSHSVSATLPGWQLVACINPVLPTGAVTGLLGNWTLLCAAGRLTPLQCQLFLAHVSTAGQA